MCDVIIVGAGPAGSATAILLAREGFDVLLVDRAFFPRDKPCGEFLTPGCVPILRRLGVWERLLSAGMKALPSATLCSPNGACCVYTPSPDPAGWSLRRTDLDNALVTEARAAGAELLEDATVRGLERGPKGVTAVRIKRGGTQFAESAPLVIGADGSHSVVARALGLVRPIRRLQRLAIVSHWNGLSAQSLVMRSRESVVCGLGPLAAGRANVTLVVKTAEAASLAGRAADFLVEAIKEHFPDLQEQMEGAALESVKTIGCFGHVTRSPFADGAMLVGDSACFIDPFTGEGIYMALRGAELAAGVAARALRAGNTSAASLAGYDALRDELRRRYRLCDLVQAIVRTPLLFNRVATAFNRSPAGRDRVMAVLGDLQPAAAVLDPPLLADMLAFF